MAEANSTTEVDEEFYDDATEAFPSIDDLVPLASAKNPETVGRLVAIWALENGSAKGDNGSYPYTNSITLVLDDGPDGDQFTDLVGSTADGPIELKLRHSTTGIQSRLAPRVDGWTKAKRDPDTGDVIVPSVPMKFRPMIGRLNTKPSTKYKKGSPAVSISKMTDEDKPAVQKYAAEIKAINARLENQANEAEDSQAFE